MISPRAKDRAASAAMAAAVAALISLAMQSCSGCIGIVEWGDPGDGIPVEFPAPVSVEATP